MFARVFQPIASLYPPEASFQAMSVCLVAFLDYASHQARMRHTLNFGQICPTLVSLQSGKLLRGIPSNWRPRWMLAVAQQKETEVVADVACYIPHPF